MICLYIIDEKNINTDYSKKICKFSLEKSAPKLILELNSARFELLYLFCVQLLSLKKPCRTL